MDDKSFNWENTRKKIKYFICLPTCYVTTNIRDLCACKCVVTVKYSFKIFSWSTPCIFYVKGVQLTKTFGNPSIKITDSFIRTLQYNYYRDILLMAQWKDMIWKVMVRPSRGLDLHPALVVNHYTTPYTTDMLLNEESKGWQAQ